LWRVLGPMEVRVGDSWVPVTTPKLRALLAALLAEPGRMLATDDLADELWGLRAPAGARKLISGYVLQLRRLIGDPDGRTLITQVPGYRLAASRADLDAACFEDLLVAGRQALRHDDPCEASELLASGLALWRGSALGGVPRGPMAAAEAERLEELRLAAVELRIDARIRTRRAAEVIAELRALTARYPLRERFWYQLMVVLEHSGRGAEALATYATARDVICAELGAEPGAELQDLHLRLLRGIRSDSGQPARGALAPAQYPARLVVPRQLLGPVRHFAGRTRELAALTRLTERPGRRVQRRVLQTALTCAISGSAGVGKTALALCWAQQIADRFPDGQLYVNLRGYDEDEPVPAPQALAGFLRALGVDGRDIPADEQERAAQYRSVLAGRRVLVVLDNARDAEHARPLLPGSAGCMAIVTSRDALAGLVARDGAERLRLDALPAGDALALLRSLLGDRVDAEPEAAAALAELCCRLPLALRLAAELATARPAALLARMVTELADERQRLDLLDAGRDPVTAMRSVFSWSCRHLDPASARAFRLIGLHPGPDLEPCGAAALMGCTPEQARRVMGGLTNGHLLQGTGANRYGMHDLLRAYAREQGGADGSSARRAALTGLFDHYLYTAAAAMDILYPAESSRRPALPVVGMLAPVSDAQAAQRWLDAERANLIAVAAHAADHGWPAHAMRISATIERDLTIGFHLTEAMALHGHALRAARSSGDRSSEAAALTHLGMAECLRNGYRLAADYHRQACALFKGEGNRAGMARALHRLALMERHLGRLRQAAAHATQGLRLCEQDGDRLGQARALQNLGTTKRVRGDYGAAAADQRQAMAIFAELGDRLAQSVTLRELGIVELQLGRLGPAAGHLRRARALCRETSNPSGQAAAMSLLGLVWLRRGHPERAVRYQERALAIFRRLCDREGEGEALTRLALADLDAGNFEQAVSRLELALDLARTLGTRPLENSVLNGLGEAMLLAGQSELASPWFAAALQLARQTGNQGEEAQAQGGLALARSVAGTAARPISNGSRPLVPSPG
jgi:DNA-binding SARP family transcriptional activator/tetratricopeptide (TPR) repeat protein